MPMMTVSDLKQWAYCPRVVFFERHMPRLRPTTYMMTAGKEAGAAEEGREERRTLRAYGLEHGERTFSVTLQSATLGVRGIADMVITTDHEQIPVDYKLAKKLEANMALQISVYALMLEERTGVEVQRGFVYLIPLRRAVEVRFDPTLRAHVLAMIAQIRSTLINERFPPPVSQIAKCVSCEYRRFCNDVR
jgi:CRISPR-associated exonuclease Cas4